MLAAADLVVATLQAGGVLGLAYLFWRWVLVDHPELLVMEGRSTSGDLKLIWSGGSLTWSRGAPDPVIKGAGCIVKKNDTTGCAKISITVDKHKPVLFEFNYSERAAQRRVTWAA